VLIKIQQQVHDLDRVSVVLEHSFLDNCSTRFVKHVFVLGTLRTGLVHKVSVLDRIRTVFLSSISVLCKIST